MTKGAIWIKRSSPNPNQNPIRENASNPQFQFQVQQPQQQLHQNPNPDEGKKKASNPPFKFQVQQPRQQLHQNPNPNEEKKTSNPQLLPDLHPDSQRLLLQSVSPGRTNETKQEERESTERRRRLDFSSSSSLSHQQQQQLLHQQQQQQFSQQFFPQQQPQFPFQLQQPQQQLQFLQQQLHLYRVDGSPADYNTNFQDLHPDLQRLLLQIEERIKEYKGESQRLDQCSRLYDLSADDGFKLDASRIMQELGGISSTTERAKVPMQELMAQVNTMMLKTEVAVRSHMILRQWFRHPNAATTSSVGTETQTMGSAVTPSPINQPMASCMVSNVDFYSGLPRKPSPFLQYTVARFEKYLIECCQRIEELEQLVLKKNSSSSGLPTLQSLPVVMSNVHDFFLHVAAKVESLHQNMESIRMAYLVHQHRHNGVNDPFLEANRREATKQEAAARRVHPTLHLPAISAQPSTQVAGLFASSSTHGASSASQQFVGNDGGSSGSAFSIIPGAASTSPCGSTRTPLTFGHSSSSFASSPAIGSSQPFSTPSFGSGVATGSGTRFGAASESSKRKSRSTRG